MSTKHKAWAGGAEERNVICQLTRYFQFSKHKHQILARSFASELSTHWDVPFLAGTIFQVIDKSSKWSEQKHLALVIALKHALPWFTKYGYLAVAVSIVRVMKFNWGTSESVSRYNQILFSRILRVKAETAKQKTTYNKKRKNLLLVPKKQKQKGLGLISKSTDCSVLQNCDISVAVLKTSGSTFERKELGLRESSAQTKAMKRSDSCYNSRRYQASAGKWGLVNLLQSAYFIH